MTFSHNFVDLHNSALQKTMTVGHFYSLDSPVFSDYNYYETFGP